MKRYLELIRAQQPEAEDEFVLELAKLSENHYSRIYHDKSIWKRTLVKWAILMNNEFC
jgi:hypothetical protein